MIEGDLRPSVRLVPFTEDKIKVALGILISSALRAASSLNAFRWVRVRIGLAASKDQILRPATVDRSQPSQPHPSLASGFLFGLGLGLTSS